MSTKTISQIIAEVNAAKAAIKGLAVAAREAAPKGHKMAHGQHAAAEGSQQLAKSTVEIVTGRGFVPSAVAAKVSKSGRTEFVVTYREAQTLEQRVTTHLNAAARRKAKREADKAATTANVTTLPTSAEANLTNLAAQLSKKAA